MPAIISDTELLECTKGTFTRKIVELDFALKDFAEAVRGSIGTIDDFKKLWGIK